MAVDPTNATQPANTDPIGDPDVGIQVEMRAIKAYLQDLKAGYDTAIASAVADAAAALAASVGATPIGAVIMHGSATVPANFLAADGSEVSRITYATLFSIIGVENGPGDGANTFNLPNGPGRTPVGMGFGAGLTARTFGTIGGEEAHQILETELPEHSHILVASDGTSRPPLTVPTGPTPFLKSEGSDGSSDSEYQLNGSAVIPTVGLSGLNPTDGDKAAVMQPFFVTNYIIRYQ